MLGDNTGVYRIDGLFLKHQITEFHRYITRPVVMRPSASHTLSKSELSAFTPYIVRLPAHAMTLCGVHDRLHVHTTVAHTCDYPLYLYRHTPPSKT